MAKIKLPVPKRIQSLVIGLVVILIALAYVGLKNWHELSSTFTRQIAEGSVNTQTLWIKESTFWFQGSDESSDTVYAYTTEGDLMALDSSTGLFLWNRRLP